MSSSGLQNYFNMNYKYNCSQLLEKHHDRELYNIPVELQSNYKLLLNFSYLTHLLTLRL